MSETSTNTRRIKVSVKNVQWDVDHPSEKAHLSKNLCFDMTVDTDVDDEMLDELISDEVSNQTGFCHKGYEISSIREIG